MLFKRSHRLERESIQLRAKEITKPSHQDVERQSTVSFKQGSFIKTIWKWSRISKREVFWGVYRDRLAWWSSGSYRRWW